MFRIDPRLIKNFDFILFFSTLLLSFIGLITIGSSSFNPSGQFPWSNMAQHQLYWIFIGLVISMFAVLIDYEFFTRVAYPLFIMILMALVVVLFLGTSPTGARRWIKIGILPSFQPSEFAKISLILVLSQYFSGLRKETITPRDILYPAILTGVVFVLIAKEPDLGTAFSLVPIFIAISYVAGLSLKFLITVFAIGSVTGVIFIPRLLKPYQLQRLKGFLNPEQDPYNTGYHLIQSKIAVGSGQMWGNWFFQGKQSRLDFLPASHTDFIFSVYAEDWGFVGGSILLALFLLIIIRCLKIGWRSKDTMGTLVATGIAASFTTHIFINIGMSLGILPVTGLPLPFLSYGGSAMVVNLFQVGLLLNIGMRRLTFL